MFIGLFSIVFVLWIIFNALPSLLYSLFYSILGNLLLLLVVIVVAMYSPSIAFLCLIIFILLVRLVSVSSAKEGFTWTDDSINKFIQLEDTLNQNNFYDIGMIQEHTSQDEVNYFLKYGMWPWSTQTIQMYTDAINKNTYIQTYSKDSVKDARKIYPEFSIVQALALQTPEGNFLTNGMVINDVSQRRMNRDGRGSYPYRSNQIYLENRGGAKQVKCSVETGRPIQINNQGDILDLQDEDLPKIIPGFEYINQPCNVCDNLSGKKDTEYRCAFRLFNQPSSSIWNWLWSQDK